MSTCKTDIDWNAKPAPWRYIGPAFRGQCERIAKDSLPAPKPLDSANLQEGLALRQRRVALGLTQEVVADRAGYGKTAISEVESGRAWPAARRVIAEALTQLEAARK